MARPRLDCQRSPKIYVSNPRLLQSVSHENARFQPRIYYPLSKHKSSFHHREAEFRRQFSRWGYRKNGTQEGWQYVDFRQKKRKQEGKDPGDVYMNQKYVDPRKVRKMTARNVPLSSQYTMMGASGAYSAFEAFRVELSNPKLY